MAGKAVISLTTGMEDPEKVTVAFLVAVGAAESGRPTLVFLSKEAVRLALEGVAAGVAYEGCRPCVTCWPAMRSRWPVHGLPGLFQRQAPGQGRAAVRRRARRHRSAVGVDRRRRRHHLQLLTGPPG